MENGKVYIKEMLEDLSKHRPIIDLTEEEFTGALKSSVDVIKEWLELEKKKDKASLFAKRTPLGTLIKKYKSVEKVFALYNHGSGLRPEINSYVLIYDREYDEILSGVITSLGIKSFRGDRTENIIMEIALLFGYSDVKLEKRYTVKHLLGHPSLVFIANGNEIRKIFGMPEKGIILGICSKNGEIIRTETEGPLYYILKPELLKTHIMVGGVTGQGKTIFLKNLIYELAVHGGYDFFGSEPAGIKNMPNNAVVFDLQGDLIQVLEPMPEELIPDDYKPLYKDLEIGEFRGLGEMITNDDLLFLKPFYVKVKGFMELFPWKDFGISSSHIRTHEDLAAFLPMLTPKGHQLLSELFDLFMESRTEPFNFGDFFKFVTENRVQVSKGKKYVWFVDNNPNFYEYPGDDKNADKRVIPEDAVEAPAITADALIRRLRHLKSLKIFDHYPPIDINELLEKRLVFIYFPDFPGYSAVRSIILLDILTRIYYTKRFSPDYAMVNNLIFIDEAHELLPRKHRSSDLSEHFFGFIEKRFAHIAKEGRKFGMSLVTASQILSELNDEVKFNAQTRIFFKLSEKDIKFLNPDKYTLSLLDKLRRGYAVVYSGDNLAISRAVEVRVLPPVYLHCDPRVADKFFEKKIEEVRRAREEKESDR